MAPKRRSNANVNESCEQSVDNEDFLKALEAPTKIYRYLAQKHPIVPTFLHRNLRYMKGRCTRLKSNRNVNSVLEYLKAKATKINNANFLHLNFKNYKESSNRKMKNVEIKVFVVEIKNSKRKFAESKKCREIDVAILNNESNAVISIPSTEFTKNNSFSLLLKVCVHSQSKNTNDGNTSDVSDSSDQSKRRLRSNQSYVNGGYVDDSPATSNYIATLKILDSEKNCLFTDGSYQVILKKQKKLQINNDSDLVENRAICWQSANGSTIEQFEVFDVDPTIQFNVVWNDSSNFISNSRSLSSKIRVNGKTICPRNVSIPTANNGKKIFYQFMYSVDSARQQTEASRDNLKCPWCHVKGPTLYALLKHLRLCHSRFLFTFTDNAKAAKIDVSINHCFDAYLEIGPPEDLHSDQGICLYRYGPVKRKSWTSTLVSQATYPSFQLSEFFDRDADNSRPLTDDIGHNRLYYHSATCRPIDWREDSVDSEEENDPEWLRNKMQKMISEFTDVNEAEKKMMILWNLHLMPGKYISDNSMITAVEDLMKSYINELIPIQRNFILHLKNLYDFNIIDAEQLRMLMDKFMEMKEQPKSPEPKRLRNSRSPSKQTKLL